MTGKFERIGGRVVLEIEPDMLQRAGLTLETPVSVRVDQHSLIVAPFAGAPEERGNRIRSLRGKYRHLVANSEAFARQKQREIDRER